MYDEFAAQVRSFAKQVASTQAVLYAKKRDENWKNKARLEYELLHERECWDRVRQPRLVSSPLENRRMPSREPRGAGTKRVQAGAKTAYLSPTTSKGSSCVLPAHALLLA
jgi:hypothetical protein